MFTIDTITVPFTIIMGITTVAIKILMRSVLAGNAFCGQFGPSKATRLRMRITKALLTPNKNNDKSHTARVNKHTYQYTQFAKTNNKTLFMIGRFSLAAIWLVLHCT